MGLVFSALMQRRPTFVQGSHNGVIIKYDEQEVLVESMKPVEMQNWHAHVTLKNITWPSLARDGASPPQNFLTITSTFQGQSWEAVWAKTIQLCDGNLFIWIEPFFESRSVKPGDEITIKPGLCPE